MYSHTMQKENHIPAAAQTIQTTTLSIRPNTGHARTTSASSVASSSLSPYASSSSAASASSSLRQPLSRSDSHGNGNTSDDSLNRSADFVLAMHDYAADPSSGTCLSFKAGQVIRVFNRDNSGWWDGELDGVRGWFPSNYVSEDVSALNHEASPVSAVGAVSAVRVAC
jgi:son of sevenless-like protein